MDHKRHGLAAQSIGVEELDQLGVARLTKPGDVARMVPQPARTQDIASHPPAIMWRKEFDKRRREQTVPIPESLAHEIRTLRAKLRAFRDGWLFPQASGEQPWHRKRFDALMRRAEKKAKVPKLDGGLWHCYRRKWATERRHLPAVDVMTAGGWADRKTMETCYQHADDAGVLAVMESPTKLRERKLAGSP